MESQNYIQRARENGEPIDDGLIWETLELDDTIVQFPDEGGEWRMDKTEEVYSQLPKDAPYPEMERVSNDSEEAIVYEKVGERSLNEVEQGTDEYLDLVGSAGQALANLHFAESEGYGEPVINERTKERNYNSWIEYIQAQLEDVGEMTFGSPFEEAADKAISEFDIEKVLEAPDSRLLHADYSSDNLMVEGGSVTVIDFDNAVYGDPDFGFVRSMFQLCDDEEEASRFRKGYESVREPKISDEEERNYRALATALSAKAGAWCIESRPDADIDIPEWAEDLTEYAENEL